ncbi:hypothetical protein QTP88_005858 [Uroleucon formosanum]
MTLPPKHIRPSEVEHAIQKSPRRKTPGYDLITSEVAVKLPKKALLMLTHIYNSMLRLSYFPLLWKFSVIIMILKPGKPPDSPKSYRPISLFPLFSKIFEKIILKRILPVIESNLPNNQFGFRHNHSTIHQIHRLVDNISYALEKKLICTGVFLDVAQAFDTVWHEGLLLKLKTFLPPYYYLLFKSYLKDRHFSVRSGSAISEIFPICAGVPQGAVAAPLLFNLYTSDQPTTDYTITGDFADDKALLALHTNPETASNLIQNHLNLLSIWYKDWGIKVNETKSVHCTFTLRQAVCPPVYLNHLPLPSAQNVRYLGRTIQFGTVDTIVACVKKKSKKITIMSTNFQKLHTAYPFDSISNHNPLRYLDNGLMLCFVISNILNCDTVNMLDSNDGFKQQFSKRKIFF